MPFNEMKIDQAFVRDAVTNRDARKVVRASASLGRELGLKVVAEGVETEVIAQLVTDAGCDIGQGWLYGRAVPPDIFQADLEQSSAATTADSLA
jgi:EAL domain-containing protein (putative c-di-GMP-specific phosphodiesterase class I)